MTDYIEEQKGELETLHCIYTDEEFTEVSEDPPCFQIDITSSQENVTMSVTIQFTYPPTYPDVPPELSVVSYTGPSEQQIENLEAYLNEMANENVGMVMIFTLMSALQDKLSEFIDSIQEEKERVVREKEEELKRIEEARFFGTPVTKENFKEWRRKFDEEMRLKMPKSSSEGLLGLTGRQMFEKDASLALSDARFLTEASEATGTKTREQENIEVDESLFQDLDDLQI